MTKPSDKFRNFLSWLLFGVLTLSFSNLYAQRPVIETVDYNRGFAGLTINISGSGFNGTPSNNVVMFGSARGTVLSATTSTIEVKVPNGASYDNITVTNLGTKLSGVSPLPFSLVYGGGTFSASKIGPGTIFAALDQVYDLCLCDFNNDGRVDIATSSRGSSFGVVYQNTSTPSNINFNPIAISLGAQTINLKCKDLNNDGKPEIVYSKKSAPTDKLIYLKNISSAATIQFAPPVVLEMTTDIPKKIEIEDLNLDGKPELIVSNETQSYFTVYVNESDTDIAFNATPIDFTTGRSEKYSSMAVRDLNNDKKPDVVLGVLVGDETVVMKNTSSGSNVEFTYQSTISTPGGLSNLGLADLNNDKKIDLVAVKYYGYKVGVSLNNSSNGGDITFETEKEFNTRAVFSVAFSDLNGDGWLDMSFSSISNPDLARVMYFMINNTASGTLDFTTSEVTAIQESRTIGSADFDGDGKPDVALTLVESGAEKLGIYRNSNCFAPRLLDYESSIDMCDGAALDLVAFKGYGATYTWKRKDLGSGTTTNVKVGADNFYSENPTVGNFEYWVEATSIDGCNEVSRKTVVNVQSGSLPSPPSITGGGTVCEGESFTLTATAASIPSGASFNWTLPSGDTRTGQSITISNATSADAGQYSVNIKVGICASNEVLETVNVQSISSINIGASGPTEFCQGGSVVLSVPNNADYNYQWYNGSTPVGANNYSYTANASGEFKVRITTISGGCVYTTSATQVLSVTKPVAAFDAPAIACGGNTVAFENNSTGASGTTLYYSWDFGDGNVSSSESPSHIYSALGTYTVKMRVSYADATCFDETTQVVKIETPPTISIDADGDTEFCEGGSVLLTASAGFDSYKWNSGETAQSIEATENLLYKVEGKDSRGCSAIDQIQIDVSSSPNVQVSANSTTISKGESVQLEASGADAFEWTPAELVSDPTIANPISQPDITTTYYVTGYDLLGCSGEGSITIEVFNDPNKISVFPDKFFTPNGDSKNDVWEIGNIQEYQEWKVSVFNRQGNVVYEQLSYDNTWDGTDNGKTLPEGTYYFVIRHKDSSTNAFTGSVTILR